MRILALDVGEKKIGLATTDPLKVGVWPRPSLIRQQLQQDCEALCLYIRELAITHLVVGYPYHQDGREGAQAKKVKAFAQALEKMLKGEGLYPAIHFVDERLSSWEAERRLLEAGFYRGKKKNKIDSVAACVILEQFLEMQGKAPHENAV